MSNRAEGVAEVFINDQQAQNSLKQLQEQAGKLNDRLNELSKANDKTGFDKTKRELDAVKKEMKQYHTATDQVNAVLNNLSGATYNQLLKAQKKIRKEMRDMKRDTDQDKKAFKEKTEQVKLLDGELTKVQREMKYAGKSGMDFRGVLESMGVPMHRLNQFTQIQAVAQERLTAATSGTSRAMKVLRVALISSGIGAIAVAVGSLAAALFSTQRGTDALNRVLIPLRTVLQRVWGIIQELGTGIMDAFTNPKQAIADLWDFIKGQFLNRIQGLKDTFVSLGRIISSAISLDWDGVKENAKKFGEAYLQTLTGVDDVVGKVSKSIKGMGDEIKTAYQEGERLAEIKQQLEELAITMALNEGRLNRAFEEQRAILNDVNESEAERLRAGAAALKASEDIKNMKLQELALLIEEQEIKMKQNDSDREAQLELARLQAQRDQLEADHLKETQRIRTRMGTLTKEAAAELQKQLESIAAFEKETFTKIAEDLQKEIDDLDLNIDPDIEFDEEAVDEKLNTLVEKYEAAQDLINKDAEESTWERISKEQAALNQALQENLVTEEQYQQASNRLQLKGLQLRIAVLQDFTGALSELFKEGTAASQAFAIANKAFATANAIISTYEAAAKALASAPPPWNFILMGTVIAQGLAQVAKINAVQFAGGKYDVVGASDGKTYKAGYVPQAATGIYPEPTLIGGLGLVGERAPELVVDGATLDNIKMNNPAIIEGIMAHRVQQHYAGDYSAAQTGATAPAQNITFNPQDTPGTLAMISKLDKIIDAVSRPQRSFIVYSDIESAQSEVEKIRQEVSK